MTSPRQRVIAIDGPAGAGKSTIARAVAKALGIQYLDTGAMYRAVTVEAAQRGLPLADDSVVSAFVEDAVIDVGLEVVTINGRDVTQEIRTVETSKLVSIVATLSGVRAQLRRRQQAWVDQRGGGVVEGRDIATVVFPEALLKVYLTASPRVRAERRVAQIGGDVEVIARELAARDEVDSTRADSPLSAASDSVVVDTSDRTIEDVVAEIVGLFEARLASWQK
ncbi:MAG: (d)CMP kinase [Actinobacteria bacterium]|nr:(d)CMP kinase [Actinomycetota bacterium]NDC45066.1 (d)CMP kinase [Actinomycetota bacterium]